MSSDARCDVVIPTHERPKKLRALLASLAQYAGEGLGEVIVVDDSARPSVAPQEFPDLRLRLLRIERRLLISEARNRGLRESHSEFVLAIDDDNVIGADTVRHPLGHLVDHPGTAAVMPSVLYRSRPDLVWVYATPFRADRWHFDLLGRNRPRDPALEGRLWATDALPNAVFLRTDVGRALGWYDERRFPVSSSADFCQRLKREGHAVWADAAAFTYHDVEPPGAPGFAAAHSVDPVRLYYDKRDWFEFQQGIRPGERAFAVRALWHSAPSLAGSFASFLIRPDAPVIPLTVQMIRAVRDGLGARGHGPSPAQLPA
ncbi:MAG: glycosyltransferase [Thermoplasmata archaeon]